MSPEACQDLSWHRAVAETDETPFWSACSQSDGPARARERTIGRKAGRCYSAWIRCQMVSPAPLRLFHRREVRGAGQQQDANLQTLPQWVSTMGAAQAMLSRGVCGE